MDLVPQETQEPNVVVKYDGLEPYLGDLAKSTRRLAASVAATKIPKKQRFLSAMDDTFDLIGGIPRLAVWADQNPDEYYKLYAKTLPTQIQASIEGKLQHIIRPALPPSALDAIEGEIIENKRTAD